MTFANARGALAQLESALADGESSAAVTIDCAALTEFDSTAVATILALQRRCSLANKTLRCVNLPANLRKLAALYGVDSLIAS